MHACFVIVRLIACSLVLALQMTSLLSLRPVRHAYESAPCLSKRKVAASVPADVHSEVILCQSRVGHNQPQPPQHVAFIVDGNGRWALQRNLSRSDGHREGASNSVRIVNATFNHGVKFITLYLLSTENWRRPANEINHIFSLLDDYLTNYADFFRENRIEVQAIGQLSRLPSFTLSLLSSIGYQRTSTAPLDDSERKVLTLAVSYGGRDEITFACRQLAHQVANGRLAPDEVNEEMITRQLFTGQLDIPDPDLVIRTSGEQRLSNFLLWQSAYAEFNSTKTLWPDFQEQELLQMLDNFSSRKRRYGQIH